jgi:DNA polymerase III delta prime subunit
VRRDLDGPELTRSVLVDQFIAKSRVPHLLFYGPPGTGKTSTILAVARKVYGTNAALRNNCLEVCLRARQGLEQAADGASLVQLNASDDRGIDVVREQIKNFASTRMSNAGRCVMDWLRAGGQGADLWSLLAVRDSS